MGGQPRRRAARFVYLLKATRSHLDALLGAGIAVPSLLTPEPRHHENLLRFPWWPVRPVEHMLALPATAVTLGCQVVGGYDATG